jgi:LPS sulfotransferase NodH
MNLYSEQFDPALDFSTSTETQRVYIVCSTPRSGSHLIGHTLYQTGQLGFPLEYFNPVNLPQWKQRFKSISVEDTFNQIKRHRTSPNGCFGCKLHYEHFEALITTRQFDKLFSTPHFLLLRRRDLLSQAISLAKARSTGVWISSQKPISEGNYSFKAIEKSLRSIIQDNSRWSYFLARRKKPVMEVYYEDFAENPVSETLKIATFLGVDFDQEKDLKRVTIPLRQRNKSNQAWKERYLSESTSAHENYNCELSFLEHTDLQSVSSREILKVLAKRLKKRFS